MGRTSDHLYRFCSETTGAKSYLYCVDTRSEALAPSSYKSRMVWMGRYERNDAMPSIDIAKRLADAFGISLDCLVGSAEIDKASLNCLNEVSKMTPENKNLVWSFLDRIKMDSLKG